MQICKDHWEELKEKLRERGLEKLSAKTGEEAFRRTVEPLLDPTVESVFDPLMNANNRIWENTLRIGGLGLMAGDLCPICELIKACECGQGDACPFRTFITQAADEQLAWAKHLGLVGDG